MRKKILMLSITVIMAIGMIIFPSTSVFAGSNSEIKIILDDTPMQFDVPPQMINGRVMVPMRAIFEALGAEILWDGTTKTVTANTASGDIIKLTLGSTTIYKNGVSSAMDVAPQIVDGRTLVPTRFVAESMDMNVRWDNGAKTVYIDSLATSISVSLERNRLALGETARWDVTIKPENAKDQSYTVSIGNSNVGTLNGNTLLCVNSGIVTITVTASNGVSASAELIIAPTEEQAFERIIALKDKYPQGMRWTNDNSYTSGSFTGYGCAAFSRILRDEVFGSLPSRRHTDFRMLKVGDIVRTNNDTHDVVVLSTDSNGITVTEGNFNNSINWGRSFTWDQIRERGTYVLTCYPE